MTDRSAPRAPHTPRAPRSGRVDRPSRRLLLGGGLGLAAAGTLAAGTPAAAGPPARRLRVRAAAFNIHHGATAADVLDLEGTARVIEALRLDLVGLQEVDRHWSERSGHVDQAAWLARRLRMRHAYGANLDLDPLVPGAPRRQYGTAVLSRWPIVAARNTWLPGYEGHEQRGLLTAVVRAGGTRLTFATTHLQHNDASERALQAERIAELLGPRPRATILTGDLNATPDAPELKPLTAILDDVWPAAGRGDGFTYDSLTPHARIDYVLASPDIHPHGAEVVTPAPETSDHLPVTADLSLPRH